MLGNALLRVSSIKLSEEFVKQLPQKLRSVLLALKNQKLRFSQSAFMFFHWTLLLEQLLRIIISKIDNRLQIQKAWQVPQKYKEQTTIDFSQYATMLIYISEIDELKGSVDNLLKEVKEIKKLIPSTKIGDTHASKITE